MNEADLPKQTQEQPKSEAMKYSAYIHQQVCLPKGIILATILINATLLTD
ncbi:hypothetical protein [Candidatus Thiothrix anitrata]|jgi:hypothetical protein|uniref:Uncharacterized protein n=1 Tax=Candidatus Thiothrix anitrata TaxID=2823902 RepID=A0ABX7X324_9GAMM|nr:hypothetical protein [Candidatus Thiothrix anitrata]QTR50306.1 hypothetical protein J8380_01595 [Candidatus Thiothrix anitrata]